MAEKLKLKPREYAALKREKYRQIKQEVKDRERDRLLRLHAAERKRATINKVLYDKLDDNDKIIIKQLRKAAELARSYRLWKKILLAASFYLYAFVMASVIVFIEVKADDDTRNEINRILHHRALMMEDYYAFVINNTLSVQDWRKGTMYLMELVIEKNFELGNGPEFRHEPWTYIGALYYIMTTCTTIGYGYPIPKTNFGKVFTMCLFFIGVPLCFISMTASADLLLMTETFIWRTFKGWCDRKGYTARVNEKRARIFIWFYRRWLNRVARQGIPRLFRTMPEDENPVEIRRKQLAAWEAKMAINPELVTVTADEITDFDADIKKKLEEIDEDLAKRSNYPEGTQKLKVFSEDPTLTDMISKIINEHVALDDSFAVPRKQLIATILVYCAITTTFYVQRMEWSYFNSMYFLLSSMSTTGFGDFQPVRGGHWFSFITTAHVMVGIGLMARLVTDIRRKLNKILNSFVDDLQFRATDAKSHIKCMRDKEFALPILPKDSQMEDVEDKDGYMADAVDEEKLVEWMDPDDPDYDIMKYQLRQRNKKECEQIRRRMSGHSDDYWRKKDEKKSEEEKRKRRKARERRRLQNPHRHHHRKQKENKPMGIRAYQVDRAIKELPEDDEHNWSPLFPNSEETLKTAPPMWDWPMPWQWSSLAGQYRYFGMTSDLRRLIEFNPVKWNICETQMTPLCKEVNGKETTKDPAKPKTTKHVTWKKKICEKLTYEPLCSVNQQNQPEISLELKPANTSINTLFGSPIPGTPKLSELCLEKLCDYWHQLEGDKESTLPDEPQAENVPNSIASSGTMRSSVMDVMIDIPDDSVIENSITGSAQSKDKLVSENEDLNQDNLEEEIMIVPIYKLPDDCVATDIPLVSHADHGSENEDLNQDNLEEEIMIVPIYKLPDDCVATDIPLVSHADHVPTNDCKRVPSDDCVDASEFVKDTKLNNNNDIIIDMPCDPPVCEATHITPQVSANEDLNQDNLEEEIMIVPIYKLPDDCVATDIPLVSHADHVPTNDCKRVPSDDCVDASEFVKDTKLNNNNDIVIDMPCDPPVCEATHITPQGSENEDLNQDNLEEEIMIVPIYKLPDDCVVTDIPLVSHADHDDKPRRPLRLLEPPRPPRHPSNEVHYQKGGDLTRIKHTKIQDHIYRVFLNGKEPSDEDSPLPFGERVLTMNEGTAERPILTDIIVPKFTHMPITSDNVLAPAWKEVPVMPTWSYGCLKLIPEENENLETAPKSLIKVRTDEFATLLPKEVDRFLLPTVTLLPGTPHPTTEDFKVKTAILKRNWANMQPLTLTKQLDSWAQSKIVIHPPGVPIHPAKGLTDVRIKVDDENERNTETDRMKSVTSGELHSMLLRPYSESIDKPTVILIPHIDSETTLSDKEDIKMKVQMDTVKGETGMNSTEVQMNITEVQTPALTNQQWCVRPKDPTRLKCMPKIILQDPSSIEELNDVVLKPPVRLKKTDFKTRKDEARHVTINIPDETPVSTNDMVTNMDDEFFYLNKDQREKAAKKRIEERLRKKREKEARRQARKEAWEKEQKRGIREIRMLGENYEESLLYRAANGIPTIRPPTLFDRFMDHFQMFYPGPNQLRNQDSDYSLYTRDAFRRYKRFLERG